MIDSHCHLDFIEEPETALSEPGLTGVVCIGASLGHAHAAVELAERFPQVWATVGLHPTDAGEDSPELRAGLEELARHPRVVGIGESGLDDYWAQDARREQQAAFSWQLDLARRLGKPLVIHTRDRPGQDSAHRGVVETLRAEGRGVTAILHCFSGGRELLEAGLERGDYFGFAGNVTYKNAAEIQAAAREVPLERLLVETDAPFLAPVPKRGRPNRPGYVRHTLEFVAGLRGIDPAELERVTDENARRVYRLA
ncbi:MAG: TatD family hydrolase [Deinococcus sp.]